MTDVTDVSEATDPHRRPSRGVALTNWIVSRATGLLEKRASRRGFIMGSAMVGSAVAVSGCQFATQPGGPYTRITDCGPGSACTDGYTEFCCTIYDGINTCPPDSFAGGWWRADYSSFCSGTRYYIDCMQFCCGPPTGFQNFCAGCSECRCGAGCNTRKVYCNYFRYGQCHQEIVQSGPIACRVVSCVPPYVTDPACTTASAVDNATAEHSSSCLTTLPRSTQLPNAGAAFESSAGNVTFVGRSASGNLATRTFNGSAWSPLTEILPNVNSGISAAVDGSGAYVFGRGFGNALWYNRLVGGAWSGQQVLGGVPLTSDPVSVAAPGGGVYVFARSENAAVWHGRLDNGAWSGWHPIQGTVTSNLAVAANPMGVFVFGRGTDGSLWYRRLSGGAFGPWTSLGGVGISDPTACADNGGVHVFMRQAGRSIGYRRFDGATWSGWVSLGGNVAGDPYASNGPGGPFVFVRGSDGSAWGNRSFFGSWTGFQPLTGAVSTNPIVVNTSVGVYGFCTGNDTGTWWGRYNDGFSWSGWQPLGGSFRPLTGV
jgi:hypothetical protein